MEIPKSHIITITDNFVPVASVIHDECHAINVSVVRQNPREIEMEEMGRPYIPDIRMSNIILSGLSGLSVNQPHLRLPYIPDTRERICK